MGGILQSSPIDKYILSKNKTLGYYEEYILRHGGVYSSQDWFGKVKNVPPSFTYDSIDKYICNKHHELDT